MGRKMKTKFLTTALGLVIFLIPLNAQSSQPDVKLNDLKPQLELTTAQPGFGFFLDPDTQTELQIQMPTSIADFDIDADPFAKARSNQA
jgi:hypothetical protein